MEGVKKYPHMCGGVLASILLSHKKDKSPQGMADPLNKSNFIRDLARIVKPGFDYSSDSNPEPIVSYYVNCRRKTSSVVPFAKDAYIEAFRRQMEESYPLLLYRMDLFLRKYVDVADQDERNTIIREIFSIAARDSDCCKSWLFILPNGEKTGLSKLTEIHFQPFILGIWYYIVSHKIPNQVSNDVFDSWNEAHRKMRFPGENAVLDDVPEVSENEDLEELFVSDTISPEENDEDSTIEETSTVEVFEAPFVDPRTQKQVVAQFHVEAKDNATAIGQVFGGLVIGKRGGKDE